MFHILRRQMKSSFRKPLIVFTPKSLLRHPLVVSPLEEFTSGRFQALIPDTVVTPKQAKKLVFCSGKFYYDLLKAREEKEAMDVALVRIEQLFPLPAEEMRKVLKAYAAVEEVVWAQEEPRNMGIWSHLLLHFPEAVNFRPATRRFYGTPAAGSATRFNKRHQEVIEYVFDPSKDNLIRKTK